MREVGTVISRIRYGWMRNWYRRGLMYTDFIVVGRPLGTTHPTAVVSRFTLMQSVMTNTSVVPMFHSLIIWPSR
jgi:hypothetical protein